MSETTPENTPETTMELPASPSAAAETTEKSSKPKRINKGAILALVEQSSLKPDAPQFDVGDTVDVHTKILEGDKERIQIFTGTVIAKSGSGTRSMFTVRRVVSGEGVERKFPLHSPKIDKVVVKRRSVVRRAKLYYLRDRVGKSVRLRERHD